MAIKKTHFADVLQRIESIVTDFGFAIYYTDNLDPFFKGDLDGETIFIWKNLSAEDKLFNLLHLAGHSIQWNVDEGLRTLGSQLYTKPDDALLRRLQWYEWQANCYALTLLHDAGHLNLDKWLTGKYVIDMLYLTHFYKTGEKWKRLTEVARTYSFQRRLESKEIPPFIVKANERRRNGLVISF